MLYRHLTYVWKNLKWHGMLRRKKARYVITSAALPPLGKNTHLVCMLRFTAALFTGAKTWKQPKCALTGEWVSKMQSITRQIFWDLSRKGVLTRATEGGAPRAFCSVNQARHGRTSTVRFHSPEAPKGVRFIEKAGRRLPETGAEG